MNRGMDRATISLNAVQDYPGKPGGAESTRMLSAGPETGLYG